MPRDPEVTKIARPADAARGRGPSPGPGPGSAALRQRLWFVVAGDFGAAIEDPGAALGDGAVKRHKFRVEVAARLRLRHEMVMAILAAHEGGTILGGELGHVSRDIADGEADAPVVRRVDPPPG